LTGRAESIDMFERFTDGARNAVVLARMEALVLRHPYIGTEHLLLGITIEQEGLAARVLASLGITAERVREQVVRIVTTPNQVSSEQIPFTPHAKRVLELALREGLRLGTNQIGTEHILLGLLGEEDGGAVGILVELEVDAETIHAQLLSRLVDLRSEPGLETRPGRATRHPVDQSWFGALGAHVNMLAKEIRRDLERDPDPGDLLIALAGAPHTLVAAALGELGVDPAALPAAVQRARAKIADADRELPQQILEVTQEKERAIEAREFEEADRLREQQRDLTRRQRARDDAVLLPEVLREIRRSLHIEDQRGSQPPHAT
jgi:ATP-dependent Clp protease ATP-binding subunit ClpA